MRQLRESLWATAASVLMLGVMVGSSESSDAGSEAAVLEELLGQVQAALDPYYGQSDPSAYVARFANKMTYFDVWSNGKIEDAAAKDHLMSFAGQIPPFSFEIVNPRVDLFEDAAVLTFNVDVVDPAAGETFAIWNTTEVHRRTDDGWELVHAHWSFAVPPPEAPEA